METAILEAPDVPEPLWPVLGSSLDGLIWRSLLDGVEHYPIALTRHAKGDLRLLKLQPGARIPMHGHDGEEHTLVLRGECEDAYGRYTPGDFTDLDDDTQHSVVGVGDQPCIILIGSETTPKFLPKHG